MELKILKRLFKMRKNNRKQPAQASAQAPPQQQQDGEGAQPAPAPTRRPRQRRAAQPVSAEAAAPSQSQPRNPTQRKTGLAASLGDPIPRGNPQAFAPTHLSTSGSQERNDPLLLDSVLVDGINGAVACARERNFQLDYSQYIQIIKSSYHVMTRLDRGLQKFLSYSVYQYYCIVLLWKRLQYVLTERGIGVNDYEAFKRSLPPMAIPDEIGYYLDGIGNLTDYNVRSYYLELQGILRMTQVEGIAGTYGRVDSVTHIAYETLPSPFVAVYRILQDVARTQGLRRVRPIDVDPNWNLPMDLRPAAENLSPNRNLLCWDRSAQLTVEQLSMCTDAGLLVDFDEAGTPTFDVPGVRNLNGIPIIYQMLLQTSELLSGSKSQYNNHAEATSYKGSLAIVGFNIRGDIPEPAACGYFIQPLSEKECTAHFYTQVSVHMCSAASLFRYRIKRILHGTHNNLCYTGPRGGAPAGWDVNADAVFESCPTWNMLEFRTTMVSGLSTCDRYSERIRKIAPSEAN